MRAKLSSSKGMKILRCWKEVPTMKYLTEWMVEKEPK
jgi:hypothetical protein